MILKNKALAIFNFLAGPSDKIYDRTCRIYFKELSGVLEGKTPLKPEQAQILEIFPEIAGSLGPKVLGNPALAEIVQHTPMAALQLLLRDYSSLYSVLEPVVLADAEATFHLLKQAAIRGIKLSGTLENYLLALLKNPFWALQWYGQVNDEKVLSYCLNAAANPSASAGAAYMHLYFDIEADPLDFRDKLATEPLYAYLASKQFYNRGIEFNLLDLKGLTPRWAYHFITDGFLDDEEGLVDTMLKGPDWLIEYLTESERYKDLESCKALLDKAVIKSPAHPLLPYLRLWWDRVSVYVKNNPPPPKKSEQKTS
jgi:hypothetical protein